MSSIVTYLNPFTIAHDSATAALEWYSGDAPHPNDGPMIIAGNRLAAELELLDRPYYVVAKRAVALSPFFRDGEPLSWINYTDVTFDGIFDGYERTVLPKTIGTVGINAFCASFKDVCVYPKGIELPKSMLLSVPVLSKPQSKLLR